MRYPLVDTLRGLAMLWMTVFHFCFDLSHLGYWRQNFLTDPVWTGQRTAIVSLFLFSAGLGQAIAWQQGVAWLRFGRRWGHIVLCALLVTLGSWLMFDASFIYFGVLHGMAVMLLAARLLAGLPVAWLGVLGCAALLSPWLADACLQGQAAAEVFNSKALNWLGWITRKPVTQDYVPVFPWLGVMLWGLGLGKWLLARPAPAKVLQTGLPAVAWLGRRSLWYYMLHQPLLLGALLAWGWLRAG